MAENWYYVQSGTRHGPITFEALQGLLSAGTLLPTDSVWKEGMSGWEMAGKVPGLLPPPPAASPPPVSGPSVTAPPVVTPQVVTPPGAHGSGAIPNIPGVTTTTVLPPINAGLRKLIIICAAALLLAFFTPYFYVWSYAHFGTTAAPPAEAPDAISRSALPFGWSFWWCILIFVFAFFALAAGILDLVLKIAVVRAITKWVMLGVFAVAALLAVIHVPLAIFGILIGGTTIYEKGEPEGYTYNEVVEGTRGGGGRGLLKGINAINKEFREASRNGTKEQKENAEKAIRDTYATLWAIPIGSVITLAAGALGLWAALQIVQKKK